MIKNQFLSPISQILFLLIMLGVLVHGSMQAADFQVFYLAGQRVRDGVSIYQFADGWMPFKYHPTLALFFGLFSFMSLTTSALVFNVLQCACWFWGASIWARSLGYKMNSWPSRLSLLLLSLSAFSAEIGYGQINGFVFLGMTLLFQLLESQKPKPILAGVVLAFLVSIKLNLALLAIYAFVKNWRTIFGGALGVLILHLSLALYFRDWLCLDVYAKWLEVLLGQSSAQFDNMEAQGFLRAFLLFWPDNAKMLWLLSLVLFSLFGVLIHFRCERRSTLMPLFWLSGTFLFSPLAWWYQILYLFPLAFYLWNLSLSRIERAVIVISFCVITLANYNTLGSEGIISFKMNLGYFAVSLALCAIFFRILIAAPEDKLTLQW